MTEPKGTYEGHQARVILTEQGQPYSNPLQLGVSTLRLATSSQNTRSKIATPLMGITGNSNHHTQRHTQCSRLGRHVHPLRAWGLLGWSLSRRTATAMCFSVRLQPGFLFPFAYIVPSTNQSWLITRQRLPNVYRRT